MAVDPVAVDGGNEWWKYAKLTLEYNGVEKQNADVSSMIYTPAEQIYHLSKTHDLYDGDIIFTGTPAGVGPVDVNGNVRVVMRNDASGDEVACEFVMVHN